MKYLVRWMCVTTLASAAMLTLGNSADPWLWAYAGTFGLIGFIAIRGMAPDLARERFEPPTPGADRRWLRAVRLVALAHVVVAVADSRYGWTGVAWPIRAISLTVFVLGFALIVRASRANRYFSAVVRVQRERGHRVVDAGPYAVVRHPGYTGMIAMVPCSGLALGSWIAFGVGLLYSALILRRAWFEDGYLRSHLEGYTEYATRVPWRLVPRVW
jgi:protein-S-isoprenylcysteine O-methyltransferase Ste14